MSGQCVGFQFVGLERVAQVGQGVGSFEWVRVCHRLNLAVLGSAFSDGDQLSSEVLHRSIG